MITNAVQWDDKIIPNGVHYKCGGKGEAKQPDGNG